MGSCCWRYDCPAHFTGYPGIVLPLFKQCLATAKHIDRANQIGVFLESAFDVPELRLRLAVIRRYMIAARTGAAGIACRHRNQESSAPGQRVIQLTPEREPALIEDRLVQAGFCPHVPARLFGIARRRLRHRPHLQVFETDNRVVLADCVRRLVQEVFADVADAGPIKSCCCPVGDHAPKPALARTPMARALKEHHASLRQGISVWRDGCGSQGNVRSSESVEKITAGGKPGAWRASAKIWPGSHHAHSGVD